MRWMLGWLFELGVLSSENFYNLKMHVLFFFSLCLFFLLLFYPSSASPPSSCTTFFTFVLVFVSVWYFRVRLAYSKIKVKTKQTKNEQRKFEWKRNGFNEMLKCVCTVLSRRFHFCWRMARALSSKHCFLMLLRIVTALLSLYEELFYE